MCFETYVIGGNDPLPRKFGMVIELPEPINIPAGSTYFTWTGKPRPELTNITAFRTMTAPAEPVELPWRSFVSLRFQQVQHPMPSPVTEAQSLVLRSLLSGDDKFSTSESHGTLPTQSTYSTVVEVVTPLIEDDDGELSPSDAFDTCLAALNRYLRAYRVVFSEPIRPVTRERLPMAILYYLGDLRKSGAWDSPSLLLLHMHPPRPYLPSPPDSTVFPKLQTVLGRLTKGDPIHVFLDHWLRADYALERDGDYSTAVVRAYMACETLLDTILTLMMWEEGLPPEDAASNAFDERTAKRVKTHFNQRLGGTWETEGNGPVAKWAQVLGGVRHRIIHFGYDPTRQEALSGMSVLRDLDEFVRDRLVAKGYRYPRTALLFLGEPGLKKRGGWTRRMREFIAQSDSEPDWIESYAAWRERFDMLRPIFPSR